MNTKPANGPALITPSLIDEARSAVAGNWLDPLIAPQSAHWRIENQGPLREADAALRALFLIAYRKNSQPEPRSEDQPLYFDIQSIDFSKRPSLAEDTDERYGAGFWDAARVHSQVLIDRTPNSDPTALLLGFSEFIRFTAPNLTNQKGRSVRVLETVWEQMNVGWMN